MANLPTTFADFNELLVEQQARERQDLVAAVQAEWQKFGRITNPSLLRRVGYSGPNGQIDFVDRHPAKGLSDALTNVDRAFDILSRARESLISTLGRFHSRVVYGNLKDTEDESVLSAATADAYTYSIAATSLIQAYRHLISNSESWKAKHNELRKQIFGDGGISKFFSDLRNSNNHVQILSAAPSYTITWRETREVQTAINFDRDKILASAEWSSPAKAFIRDRDDAHVVNLVNDHYKLAKQFKDRLPPTLKVFDDIAYQDLQTIRCARESIGTLVSVGLVLQNAVPRKLDPYVYLQTWFTPDELKRAFALPNYSAEQLEFLIALRDPLKLCNDHTRKELYKLFRVAEPPARELSQFP